jgi:mRNA interferase MazF
MTPLGSCRTRLLFPITEWDDKYARAPWMVKIIPDNLNGLEKVSAAIAYQIRSVFGIRFVRQAGKFGSNILDKFGTMLTLRRL